MCCFDRVAMRPQRCGNGFFAKDFLIGVFFNRVAMRSRSVAGTDFFEGFVIGENF
jgi:hypothetical protein